MVVAMSHGDDPQFFIVPFLVTFLLGQEKFRVVAMIHGDDPQLVCNHSCHLSSATTKKIGLSS